MGFSHPCIFPRAPPNGGGQVAWSASRSDDITGRLDPVANSCTPPHLSCRIVRAPERRYPATDRHRQRCWRRSRGNNRTSRLKPYWGKPTVRNFREGRGDTPVPSASPRTLDGPCVSSLVHVVRLFSTRRAVKKLTIDYFRHSACAGAPAPRAFSAADSEL
jgi:hypothetical protein